MTKTVRIENACNSSFKVRVVYQYKNPAGEWINDALGFVPLDFPTNLASVMIHDGRRIIVEEYSE